MISGNVPNHLVSIAKTGFLTTALKPVPDYAPIASYIDMTEKNQTLVDLGAAPMPLQDSGLVKAQDFIEKTLPIKPLDWHIKVWISGNAVKDDQTGTLLNRVRGAGSNFQRHLAQQAFQALNDGDATTNFGAGYDGLAMFHDSHVDKGAAYTTVQDNKDALTLSLDSLETVMIKAQRTRDDQGEFTDFNYNTIVTDPTYRRIAYNIARNPQDYGTDNRAANPYDGMNVVISPKLDVGAWFLVASNETIKPIIIVVREAPFLDDAWKDPDQPDGGRYYFLFRGRYNFYYGDWRTAYMGHS